MYTRRDKSPRLLTPGFEHLNNFVLFDDGGDVFVKKIDQDESLTTNLVQFTKCSLAEDCTYYTMTIKSITEGEFVMFGLTNRCVPGNPMWTIDRSVRYHSNDGGIFNGGLGIKTYHPYTIGDRVTCRLDYTGPDRCLINFLKNDHLIYRQWVNLPPGQLYPTIGLSRTEAKLRVDWPRPGKGDIDIKKELTSNWFGWTGISRDDDQKVVTLTEADKEVERTAYNIQCPVAFSQNFTYFEVEVVNKSQDISGPGCNSIGLVPGNCEPFIMPGWAACSIGYHNDDGILYSDGEEQKVETTSLKMCKPGDKMGCGIVFPDIESRHFREPILVLVYFTKNGKLVYKKRTRQPRGGFFPCVGFHKQGDSVKLILDCQPPKSFHQELVTALNSADVTADFRCSELIEFSELAPSSATFTLTDSDDHPQLVQYLRYPLSDVGDGFHIEVLQLASSTDIQLGISLSGHPMEGSFLGSNVTSCGYQLKIGSLTSKDGTRTVAKWTGQKEIISCYLDYKDEVIAILCFEKNSGEMIGRATVALNGQVSGLLASVVMLSGPCTIRMNWSRSLYNTLNLDRAWGEADQWLRPLGVIATKNKLTLKSANSYSFAANAQCRQPMLTGSSFFSIKLLSFDSLPGIGLSKAVSDVNNVLGSESGEVSFLPSTGDLIINNTKWRLISPPTFTKGDILQCGMIFTGADRAAQKGVVYFCLNDQPFYHCPFNVAYGGVYPTIVFPSSGSSAEILQTSRSQPIPEHVAAEWLNNDTMEGVVPHVASEMLKKDAYVDDNMADGADGLFVIESTQSDRHIYLSHTVRDKERIEPFINVLRRHYRNYEFETSASCVGMTNKQEAIQKSELIVIFMSDLYSESHEMVLEYSCFGGKPVILAADSRMTWPPQNYFIDDPNVTRFPRVFIDTVQDHESVNNLINLMNDLLHGMNEKEAKSIMKKGRGKKLGQMNSSSTCQIF
ncbi:SPRY domain-containing protein 3-like isoform X2 [Biomphalaria pfeifferi]|uniref:SPRY domain-containing protein 3-like isoform X2 n=1 Tax=Biomphalaria pfeifferi TaxID=112525 RepID=A0AAD8BSI3_BIOPF|nr:SPRY domain-containing protein 3-like isoform X2 [Biomphalaria pfeifferi]